MQHIHDATAPLEDEKTIPLRKPIVTAKGQVSELQLREPTASELDKFASASEKGTGIGAMIALIALVSGIDRPFVEKIAARDLHACSEYLYPFMYASRSTGETSSPT